MNTTYRFPLYLAIVSLFGTASALAQVGQSPSTPPPKVAAPPVESKPKTIASLRIRSGPVIVAVDELSRAMEGASLPEMNVIYSPDARNVTVPDMVLRNVTGPDALRLITVSAGCDMEPIAGDAGQPIGYRIFSPPALPGGGSDLHEHAVSPQPGVSYTPVIPLPGTAAPAPSLPGASGLLAPPAMAEQRHGAMHPGGVPTVMGFGGMPPASGPQVRVYSLGGVTTLTKFTEVEATLRDVLKAGGVVGDAAKFALHESTNVLVVTADGAVHDLVNQLLDALQKNYAAALLERRSDEDDKQREVVYRVREEAEREQRMSLTKQLAESEERLREALRELDRLRILKPNAQ